MGLHEVALHTERLVLRGWRESDRAPFAALNADPEVMRYFPAALSRPQSDALLDRLQAGLRERGYGLWAIERRADGALLGFTGLQPVAAELPCAPAVEVGWRLARAAWGSGYATEAARAALAYGFEDVGLAEVVSFTSAANARSRAVMERLGMARDHDGDFDHPLLAATSPLRAHVLYRLGADAWRAGRASSA